jgi:hypothetical protein
MATSKAKSSKAKSTATKAAPKAAKAPAKAAPKPAPYRDSLAVKTLATLPALSSKLRAAYRLSFNDEQCDAWGEKTKADVVLKEAEKWIASMNAALKRDPDVAYSRRRLAFLCELVVLLEDEMARTTQKGAGEHLSIRSAALSLANNARADLARRLRAMAGGRQNILAEVSQHRPDNAKSVSDVQESLTALISLATRLRRDDVNEALADDVGLTESRLNAAYSALEALTGAGELTLNAAEYEGDAPSVNRIEGRVLRELRLAQRLFAEARDAGISVPLLVPSPALKAILGADSEAPAPTPPTR